MRIVIIDDEESVRSSLSKIILQEFDDSEIVAEAGTVQTGLEVLKNHKPDLLLLDIQLPDGTGFDLLRRVNRFDSKLIFITAFEEYAIKAFKFSALDYLLKPFDPEEVRKALARVKEAIDLEDTQLKLNAFLSNIQNISSEVKKIVVRTSKSIHLVNVQDIMHCQSDGNYTSIYLNGGKKLIVSRTLKEFEQMLEPYGFFRLHQSHLTNLNYLDHFNREREQVVLKNNTSLPVSSRKKDQLLKIFKDL
jgi:two-component system LytT family response regulator